MKQFRKRPKNRFPVLVLFLDLWFEKKMDVIRHDAGSIKLVAPLLMTEQKTFENDVPRLGGKLASSLRRKADHVFCPR
ncbi:MAG TPA: hypothetical protein VFB72_06665, partial [Verrucomicrobiae bacterium]|nr:hypothetical protein [Verrucomicrobiae bacterium]